MDTLAGGVKHRYVVCYDICHNRRRYRIDKVLKGWGERVQRSVFEVLLTKNNLEALLAELRPLMDEQEDSIRIYPVTANDKQLCLGVESVYITDESIIAF